MLKLVQIRDVYDSVTAETFDYPTAKFHSRRIMEAVSMFQHTARTNVMLRDEKGRFVSYQDLQVPSPISVAVRNLKPFPTGF